ncbi:MAG: STAS domain-containing protein [Pseudomonadota bacterium]
MGQILAGAHQGVYLLRFEGDVRLTLCAAVDQFLDQMLRDPEFRSVAVDLTRASGVDSTSLGLMAKLSLRAQERFSFKPTLICREPDMLRLLRSMGFDDVFEIVPEPPRSAAELGPLPRVDVPEEELRAAVLEAHQILMGLNEDNRVAFRDLVAALEADCAPAEPPASSQAGHRS